MQISQYFFDRSSVCPVYQHCQYMLLAHPVLLHFRGTQMPSVFTQRSLYTNIHHSDSELCKYLAFTAEKWENFESIK